VRGSRRCGERTHPACWGRRRAEVSEVLGGTPKTACGTQALPGRKGGRAEGSEVLGGTPKTACGTQALPGKKGGRAEVSEVLGGTPKTACGTQALPGKKGSRAEVSEVLGGTPKTACRTQALPGKKGSRAEVSEVLGGTPKTACGTQPLPGKKGSRAEVSEVLGGTPKTACRTQALPGRKGGRAEVSEVLGGTPKTACGTQALPGKKGSRADVSEFPFSDNRRCRAGRARRRAGSLGRFGGAAFVGEEVLLGEAGEGAEVGAAELGELGGFPAGEAVAAGEGLENPRVHREGLEFARAEEEDAVGDFFADAGEFEEAGFRGGVGEGFGFIEPAGAGGDEAGGLADVARAETEEAGAEGGLGDGGEFGPGGEAVRRERRGFGFGVWSSEFRVPGFELEERGAVAGGEEGDHLLDLHDLLRGTAEEAEQGLAEGLAQNAEARKGGEALGEVGIAAPGEGVGEWAGWDG
jgi:hypothetical protein